VGTQWRKEIVEAIAASDSFAVVLSKNSITSDNVRRELDIAVESRIPILPLDLDPVVIPHEMTYQLAGLQRIDLFKEFNSGIDSLLIALGDQPQHLKTKEVSSPHALVTTKWRLSKLVIGGLVGVAIGPVYSTIHIAFMKGFPRNSASFMLYLTFAFSYGIIGAIIGAVFARFWTQSKLFRRSTLVGTIVTFATVFLYLGPTFEIPIYYLKSAIFEAVWTATFVVLPLSLLAGMLVGGMAVRVSKWMSDRTRE
jgi:hypothetical protein